MLVPVSGGCKWNLLFASNSGLYNISHLSSHTVYIYLTILYVTHTELLPVATQS